MLLKAFKERVKKSGDRIAIKTKYNSLTFNELDIRTHHISMQIRDEVENMKNNARVPVTALLFEHGSDMIVSSLAALKSRTIYAPFDTTYPENRLLYMLNDSGAGLIVTNDANCDLAQRLASQADNRVNILNISKDNLFELKDIKVPDEEKDGPAYLLYTSGSTGRPKGVVQTHRNILHFANSYISTLGLTENDKLTLFSVFSHDASIIDIYSGILSGACLYPYNIKDRANLGKLPEWLFRMDITVWHSVPTLYRYFLNTLCGTEQLPDIRYVVLGGENVLEHDVVKHRSLLSHVGMVNLYGQSESSYNSSQIIRPEDEFVGVNLGKAVPGTQLIILNDRDKKAPILRSGEIVIASENLAAEYWKDDEKTKAVFYEHPEFGRIYRTGDLGWVNIDGNIEYLGRKDFQLKIRGYRIEPEEIENCLLKYETVREAAVIGKTDKNDELSLYAYVVADKSVCSAALRANLTKELPDYMIPSHFVQLEKMPLTLTNKVDRSALQEICTVSDKSNEFEGPRSGIEKKLVSIWQEVLKVEQVGINDNFFELGGHSLKATTVLAKIEQELSVEVSLRELFKAPTIKDLAEGIDKLDKNRYITITPVEKKDSYKLSSAQKRLYALHLIDKDSTAYHIQQIIELVGNLDKNKLEKILRELVKRHETLRTSFYVDEEEIVQKIHEKVEFDIEYYEVKKEECINNIVSSFLRPFDLSKAPLIRVGLIEVCPEKYILMIDMHHIITDGTSTGILIEEFARLYKEEELPELKLQYKDYAAWQNEMLGSERLKRQEEYWVDKFKREIPMLNLPTDYQRLSIQSFEGDRVGYLLDKELTKRLKLITKETGATMYMVLLASLNILLSKYSGQEDIVIGSPIAGRPHADFQSIIGMFVNTLTMRNYPEGGKTFREFLKEVKGNALEAYENQDYQFEELVEKLNIQRDMSRNPLFDVMFVMQNMEARKIDLEGLTINPYKVESMVSKFDITLTAVEDKEEISLSMEYCTKLFSRATIERMSRHLMKILKVVAESIDGKLGEIDILTGEERHQILNKFNYTKAEYPKDKMIHELFEEQAERTPNNVAVVYEDKQLTYRELNERANQLARVLREKGVKADSIVGVMVERSIEMIVGIMGILKAGGAYLPIDMEYPKDRIEYMLEDSGAEILLTKRYLNDTINFNGEVISIENLELSNYESSNLEQINKPTNLAYVIYTSGSTGMPKGAMIEHHSVINRLNWMQKAYPLSEADIILQKTTYTFDVSVWELFWWSFVGAGVCLLPYKGEKDPEVILNCIEKNKITTMHFVPSMFNVFLQYLEQQKHAHRLSSLKQIFCSGEALNPKQVALFGQQIKAVKKIKLINLYGPTEATVDVSYYECLTEKQTEIIPIGKPIDNIRLYILDRYNNPQPIGVTGELHISGVGLARGYLNKPELTKEKFVENPFVQGERMYKTGDLARWLSDGNIEYLDRIDHQVKIRGFRIELGEIENALLSHEAVKEAVVLAKEDDMGNKYLCAYISGASVIPTVSELNAAELREHLSKELPDYMIPSYFVQLEKMPLTTNGKIDRKALPEPDGNIETGVEYEAPRDEIEVKLALIWQEVLRIEKVGIKDNFFTLGGDSIKAIQVSSRIQKYGYKLQIKDLLKNPTIGELSKYVGIVNAVAEQGIITGEVGLTPIQHWFFENNFIDRHHYNQSVMLYSKEGLEEEIIKKVFTKLVEHHDILRSVYYEEEGKVIQRIREAEGGLFTFKLYDFREEKDYIKKIEEATEILQRSMNLSEGPLVKLGLFKTEEGDHLFIAIHHLVIDGVSWRILFEDLAIGYKQTREGKQIELPKKTASYKDWANGIKEYANGKEIEKELIYWKNIEELEITPITKYNTIKNKNTSANCIVTMELSSKKTDKLLKEVNRAYNTEINDILLTALGVAVSKWTGEEIIAINLEGHGREGIRDTDITRTIGWFTSMYPVVLDMSYKEIGYQIKVVKETLREIPNKGIGYGILRYLALPENRKGLNFNLKPEICFNYLGQFDGDIKTEVFSVSRLTAGANISRKAESTHAININGMIVGGKLGFSFSYSSNNYNKETMSKLAERYKEALSNLMEHCLSIEDSEVTPSDLGMCNLNIDELEEVFDTFRINNGWENIKTNIKEIYTLTPMQEGMLFHAIMDNESKAYFEQITLDIEGIIHTKLYEESLNRIIERYDVLRTVFMYEKVKYPIQVVLDKRKTSIFYEDITELEEKEKEIYVDKLMAYDKEKGFNLTKDVLIRLSVIKVDKHRYKVIWSFHHIIMDGWCLEIIMRDFMKIYDSLLNNSQIELTAVYPYSQFIRWLQTQDTERASVYWRSYLEGYEEQAVIPCIKSYAEKTEYRQEEVILKIEEELVAGITKIAKKNKVTINAIFRALWGIMLQRYNGMEDVVFGAVVSGRPAEIIGIENMVGLFINTVPVRIKTNKNEPFCEVVRGVQDNALEAKAYEYYPLVNIQAHTELRQNLIDHIITFENYPMEEAIGNAVDDDKLGFKIKDVKTFEQTNYNFDITIIPGKEMFIKLSYNRSLYNVETIRDIGRCIKNMIGQIIENPQKKIGEIEILDEDEKYKLLTVFNATEAEYLKDNTIYELFEKQVEQIPDNIAVVYENEHLTYRELNEKANQLARQLREKGVRAESIVGIMVERSPEMIIGIMGVLKAGGAYLPIDPEYPEDRIEYMLEDSKADILLTQSQLKGKIKYNGSLMLLDDVKLYIGDCENIGSSSNGSNLAYVMYTSGTTGKPKGVMIEHRNVVNLCTWMNREYNLKENKNIMQLTSICFDVSIEEIMGALINGAGIYIPDKEVILDKKKFYEFVNKYQINMVQFVPATLRELVSNNKFMESLHVVICGSDRLEEPLKDKIIDMGYELYNCYGPTEITVDAITTKCEKGKETIGKPIANAKAYILDKSNNIKHIGFAGELCIGGAGLARGYLNRPELTAEKFVENPFVPGERIYKTGDLAKWLPDGNIEFLGRIDHQVKIRGYRIELGEIEDQLMRHEAVKEAVVTAREDKNGDKYLCAYVSGVSEIAATTELREHLSKELPDYMIPSYFVRLEKMPLSQNGKIDRKALPEPEGNIVTGTEYEAPRNETEKKLALIWQEVLRVERVGIKDSFFALGGDSIKAIQVSSRLQRYQLKLEIKYILQNPTIAELSKYIETSNTTAEQGIVTGEAVLTPIQHWFFEQKFKEKQHYNQAVMLCSKDGFEEEIIKKVFTKLIEHHDILRSVYYEEEGRTLQRIRETDGKLFTIKVCDFTGAKSYTEKIAEEAERIQRSISLCEGPLVKLGFFKTGEGDHLLIVIHHLVIDGVSWRVLFEDLAAGYKQMKEGKLIELPRKTTSYKEWADCIKTYANSKEIEKEIEYWEKVEATEVAPIEKNSNSKSKVEKNNGTISLELTEGDTQKLLKEVNHAYNTEINDILLTALGIAVSKWTGEKKVAIILEGHGRERVTDTDITRTVGWFTITYPVILDMSYEDKGYQIKVVKETLREIPNKGIGYGILRYMTQSEDKKRIEFKLEPEISFNYLGQFDGDVETDVFVASKLSVGTSVNEECISSCPIEINGIVTGRRLRFNFSYSSKISDEKQVKTLVENFYESLLATIEHCVAKHGVELTPSDTGAKNLNIEDLEQLYDLFENQINE